MPLPQMKEQLGGPAPSEDNDLLRQLLAQHGSHRLTSHMRPLAYLLQITGLVVTLGSLFWYGFQPTMGPMLYTAMAGTGAFYLGTILLKRQA